MNAKWLLERLKIGEDNKHTRALFFLSLNRRADNTDVSVLSLFLKRTNSNFLQKKKKIKEVDNFLWENESSGLKEKIHNRNVHVGVMM